MVSSFADLLSLATQALALSHPVYDLILALVLFPTIPSASSPFSLWNDLIASLVFGPDWPSIGPGLKPLFERNCWISNVELNDIFELSFEMQASFPAFGLDTAVDPASATSPPFAVQLLWNGVTLNKSDDTKELLTSWLTI